jgi:hypothetical protein
MKGRQGRLKLEIWKVFTIPLGSFVAIPRYHLRYPKIVKALRNHSFYLHTNKLHINNRL